jgi:hypothetical protein
MQTSLPSVMPILVDQHAASKATQRLSACAQVASSGIPRKSDLAGADLSAGIGTTGEAGYGAAGLFATWAHARPCLETDAPDTAVLDTIPNDGSCREIAGRRKSTTAVGTPQCDQKAVTSIATTATAMTTVVAQPSPRSHPLMAKRPMMSDRDAISTIVAITGTAMIPLSTALQ